VRPAGHDEPEITWVGEDHIRTDDAPHPVDNTAAVGPRTITKVLALLAAAAALAVLIVPFVRTEPPTPARPGSTVTRRGQVTSPGTAAPGSDALSTVLPPELGDRLRLVFDSPELAVGAILAEWAPGQRPETVKWFTHADAELDVSGRLAVEAHQLNDRAAPTQRWLVVARDEALLAEVLDSVHGTWHDTDPGRLAWVETKDGTSRLLVADYRAAGNGPVDIGKEVVGGLAPSVVIRWGEWGFALDGGDEGTFQLIGLDGNDLGSIAGAPRGTTLKGDLVVDIGDRSRPLDGLRIFDGESIDRPWLERGPTHPFVPFATDGKIEAIEATPDGDVAIHSVDAEGRLPRLTIITAFVGGPVSLPFAGLQPLMAWSTDGRFVIAVLQPPVGSSELLIYDVVERTSERVRFDPGVAAATITALAVLAPADR